MKLSGDRPLSFIGRTRRQMLDTQPKSVSMRDVIVAAIRVAMAKSDIDQQELAERMSGLGHGWCRQTVGQVVQGKRRVSAEELLPLSVALGCPMNFLITPTEPLHDDATWVRMSESYALTSAEVSKSASGKAPREIMIDNGFETHAGRL